jgi:hypothetical protein
MPLVILDDHESAAYADDGRTLMITGAQIRQRARKHRDPIQVSATARIGITEDDRPYLQWSN